MMMTKALTLAAIRKRAGLKHLSHVDGIFKSKYSNVQSH